VEPESEEFDSLSSSSDDRGKMLIEDDCKNGSGKGRDGEIVHRPPKDFSFLNGHVEIIESETWREGDAVYFLSPRLPMYLRQTVLISCRIKTR